MINIKTKVLFPLLTYNGLEQNNKPSISELGKRNTCVTRYRFSLHLTRKCVTRYRFSLHLTRKCVTRYRFSLHLKARCVTRYRFSLHLTTRCVTRYRYRYVTVTVTHVTRYKM